jgi:hypothetical protein
MLYANYGCFQEDFRNRETRYRNIIDRLNCKVRMLESKVRVLQEATEKSTKLHRGKNTSYNALRHCQ